MISRMFSIDDGDEVRSYKGFNRSYNRKKMGLVALVECEGEIEVFVLDDNFQAKDELARMIQCEDRYNEARIVGFYQRS